MCGMGGDAVWLLSPLHHQNVPQKLPAGIKPGIKLEQSSTARALSVTKTTRRAKYSLIRLSRAAAAERGKDQPAELSAQDSEASNCFSVFSFLATFLPIYLWTMSHNESRKGAEEVLGRTLLTEGSERSEVNSKLRMSPSFCSLCST